MADSVRKVHDYATSVPDRPGEAFRVLAALVSAGVNLLGCTGSTRNRRAHINVIPDDARRFERAVAKAQLDFSRQRIGFMITGDDRTGALAEHLQRLAARGINVSAIDGLAPGAGRWGAIVWVAEGDVLRAGRVLRALLRR